MAERDEMVSGTDARIYTTNPDRPSEGRTFVWAKARWYEREEGDAGMVAFPPISDSFSDLYEIVQQDPNADLTELDDGYADLVREEFMAQDILYPYVQDAERVDEVPRAEQLDDDGSDQDEEDEMLDLHLEDLAGEEIDDPGADPNGGVGPGELAAEGMGAGEFTDEALDQIEAMDANEETASALGPEPMPSGRGRSGRDVAMDAPDMSGIDPERGEARQRVDGAPAQAHVMAGQSQGSRSPADLAASEGMDPDPGDPRPNQASNNAPRPPAPRPGRGASPDDLADAELGEGPNSPTR